MVGCNVSAEFWAWNSSNNDCSAACASVISQQLILTIHSHLLNMHDSLLDNTELHMTGIPVRFQAVFIVNHKFPTEQLDYTHK